MTSVFSKLFGGKTKKPLSSSLVLYTNADLEQSIEIQDQQVGTHLTNNQQIKEYIFLLVKDKKDNILLKRKLNNHEKFSEVMASVDPVNKGYLVMGYDSIRKNSLKLSILKNGIETQSTQAIRSGILYKFSQSNQRFQQCQFKLLPNYLIYFRLRNKDDISFIPLQNASIVNMQQNNLTFGIYQKFKTIKIKTQSKEDMLGWIYSIDDAIKIKQCQRGLAKCAQKVSHHQINKIKKYEQQSRALIQHDKVLVTDQKGRKALQAYFQKNIQQVPENDVKLLNIYNKHVYYCQLLRQQSKESHSIFNDIKDDLINISKYLQQSLKLESLSIKQQTQNTQVYKILQQIAIYLGKKYHEKLKVGRFLQQAILQSAVNNNKQQNKLHLRSIMGTMEMKI